MAPLIRRPTTTRVYMCVLATLLLQVLLSPRRISYLSQEGFLDSALHEASVVCVVVLIQLCRDDRGTERRQGQRLQPRKEPMRRPRHYRNPSAKTSCNF